MIWSQLTFGLDAAVSRMVQDSQGDSSGWFEKRACVGTGGVRLLGEEKSRAALDRQSKDGEQQRPGARILHEEGTAKASSAV